MTAHRLFVLALLLTSLACPLESAAVERTIEQPDIEVFVRQGCPHCTEAKRFLEDLHRDRPSLQVVLRDVGEDPTALRQLQDLAARYGVQVLGVPAFHLRGTLLIGYSDAESTGTKITALLDQPFPEIAGGLPQEACRLETDSSCIDRACPPPRPSDSVETPWFGRLIPVRVQGETNYPGPCADAPYAISIRRQPWQASFQGTHHPGHV